jgi:hypothetical protein
LPIRISGPFTACETISGTVLRVLNRLNQVSDGVGVPT